jgi:proteasome accessory factor A
MDQGSNKSIKQNDRVPIICGADIELGNFVIGQSDRQRTGAAASRLLLREVEGYPGPRSTILKDCRCEACRAARKSSRRKGLRPTQRVINAQDWGRKFLPANGGCIYIDMDHLELCLPEVTNAFDHVAAWHAMLRIARQAMRDANEKMPEGERLQLLVNNSDGFNHSYGSHLNFLVTRRTWDNLFQRKMQYLLWLAAFQTSSIVFTGQGKVGSENGAPAVNYQIAQRADFFEQLVGIQTTYHRPIVNSRDESLCGSSKGSPDLARLHVIFFDNTLNQIACLLKVGVMQIVIAMIEAEQINLELLLDDPVQAVHQWSHDPSLNARATLAGGLQVTAVELQLLFLEEARRFVGEGGCDGIVPRAAEILDVWEDTLLKLHRRDWPALECSLDWVLKQRLLQRVLAQRPELSWSSPAIKHLDHAFGNLDLAEGLYWLCESDDRVNRVVQEKQIAYFETNPPEDTRAWTRAMLLRAVEPKAISDVNWHHIDFDYRDQTNRRRKAVLQMTNPMVFNRANVLQAFTESETLEDLLERLGADAPTKQVGQRSIKVTPRITRSVGRAN